MSSTMDEVRILMDQEREDKRFTLIQLQIPGGYLAGKWWGPKDVRPILALHGWMDNCGSFDKLIPLLPQEYSYLAFDLPGHGLSSKYPEGMIYSYFDIVVLIERIRREYNWEKVSLMGHSLGALCCFFYASLLPDKIDLFLALEAFEPHLIKPVAMMKLSVVEFFRNEEHEKQVNPGAEPPSYNYEELLDKIVQGSNQSVDREGARYLVLRNVKRSTKYPEKFYFNFDRRLRGFDRVSRHPKDVISFASNIKVPVLYLLADDSYVKELNYEANAGIRDFMLANNPDFHIRYGPGTHHFILTDDVEPYVDEICQFLRRYRPITGKL